jgi:immune inhibitor A
MPFTKITLAALALAISSLSAGQLLAQSPKNTAISKRDPGVINKEQILYWLKKRGELSVDASEKQQQQALQQYLKPNTLKGYQLPATLAKLKSNAKARAHLINKSPTKPSASLAKMTTKNAQNKTVNVLAVLIDFPDLPYDNNRLTPNDTGMYYDSYPASHYNELIFSQTGYAGPGNQNLQSAWQYYQQVSGETLFMQGTTLDWVTADNNADYYGQNDPDDDDNDMRPDELVKEAVAKAIAANNIDLSLYDVEDQFDLDGDGNVNEPDGVIDHVMVFHSSIGEEAGGGVLGDDAIWSHRFFVDIPTLGYQIPGTNYKVLGYTIEPIDSALGVVVHEFGHDLGVPDEYNTNSNTEGSPVGYWSLMASGGWAGSIPGSQPSGLSPFVLNVFQNDFGGDWIDVTEVTYADLQANPQVVTLAQAVDHDATTNVIKVALPKATYSPFDGDFQYFSGDGDLQDLSMNFDVDVPDTAGIMLTMQAHWNIEEDWDYAQVLVNGVAIAGNHTQAGPNPRHATVEDYITGDSASVSGNTGSERWVKLEFPMEAYRGTNVNIEIQYITDESVGGYGFVVDTITLDDTVQTVFSETAETSGTVTLEGFTRVGELQLGEDQNYWIQMRTFYETDAGLNSVNYERGMLVWFENGNYSDNHVDDHPGYGFIGVVDANQNIINGNSGYASTTTQIRDATFSLNNSNPSTFDDSEDYSTPEQPYSGLVLPQLGLNFSLQSQAVDSSTADILLSVGSVAWVADFDYQQNFRTFTFENTSTGAGQATVLWSFGDGNTSTEFSPTHTYAMAGNYNVTLTMTTTSDNSTSTETQSVMVGEELLTGFDYTNTAATYDFTSTVTGGLGSMSFSWDFGDGTTSTEQSPSHTYQSSGDFDVVLTVTSSGDNQSASETQTIPVYVAPTANFTTSISNLTITFTDTSTGGDGNMTYAWDFGDGTTSTEQNPTHEYAEAGSYTVELVITDGQNNSSSLSGTFTVSEPAPPPSSSGGGGGGSMGLLTLLLMLTLRLTARLKFRGKLSN